MKKIKFAAQVFILVASFPVIFVSGITHHSNKAENNAVIEVKDSNIIKKTTPMKECLCEVESIRQVGSFSESMMKY